MSFNSKVWVSILFTLIVLSIFFYTQSKIPYLNIIFHLIQPLLDQSSNMVNQFRKKNVPLLLVVILWLLVTRLLSQSFKGLLLETYNTITPSLTVETMDDIIANRELSVVGSHALNDIKTYKPDLYRSLISRVNEAESRLGLNERAAVRDLINPSIIRTIVDRKSVLIVPTLYSVMIQSFNPSVNLKTSQIKYNSLIRYNYVSYNIQQHKRITTL